MASTLLKFPGIGPAFDDTGRIKDTIYEAASLLRECMQNNPLHISRFKESDFKELLEKAKDAASGYEDEPFESEVELKQVENLLISLIDAINHYCPPYVYFDTRGRDEPYGFWPDITLLQEDLQMPKGERWVMAVPDGDPLPSPAKLRREGIDFVVQVNDHGNLTMYDVQGNELWNCV